MTPTAPVIAVRQVRPRRLSVGRRVQRQDKPPNFLRGSDKSPEPNYDIMLGED